MVIILNNSFREINLIPVCKQILIYTRFETYSKLKRIKSFLRTDTQRLNAFLEDLSIVLYM